MNQSEIYADLFYYRIKQMRYYISEIALCVVSEERIFRMDRGNLVEECNNGIVFFIESGIDFESNYKILEMADDYVGFIYPTVGVHPTRMPKTRWSKQVALTETVFK